MNAGDPPLLYLAIGCAEMVQLLIANGAEVNVSLALVAVSIGAGGTGVVIIVFSVPASTGILTIANCEVEERVPSSAFPSHHVEEIGLTPTETTIIINSP